VDGKRLERERGFALSGRGLMYFDLGEMAKARADLEAALATPWVDDPDPAMHCEAHYKLARALVAIGGDDARARQLARTAEEECRAAGERGAEVLAELSAWARVALPGLPS
jgi:hypothetical protein